MSQPVEALIVSLRVEHPGWGPETLLWQLEDRGVVPLPSRSGVYRCLIRHGLIQPGTKRRKRADYKRWERSTPMELWQMDVVGGVRLSDGTKASIVSGIDDHSRFVVSALMVARATARPVTDALAKAMRAYGVPDQILTDNGKVFTNRYGKGTGEVLFDKVCRQNGIKHLLTKPRSPTTTGKIERWHKTLRAGCLAGQVFDSIPKAQVTVNEWVHYYNHERRHQGIGGVVPWDRFKFAGLEPVEINESANVSSRKVSRMGQISYGGHNYGVGTWLAGETVKSPPPTGSSSLSTKASRSPPTSSGTNRSRNVRRLSGGGRSRCAPKPRQPTVGQIVTRKVDSGGSISFAGKNYRVGSQHARRQVQVAMVDDTLEISAGGVVIRAHPIRHDRSREHGAFANAGGRPSRSNAA